MFLTVIFVTTMFLSRLVIGLVYSTSARPLIGGVNFLPASTDCSGGVWLWDCAKAAAAPAKQTPSSVAATTKRARVILTSREWATFERERYGIIGYISPFQSSGSGFTDRKISMCHLPPPHGSITSAATTSTRISENNRPAGSPSR